MTLGTTHSVVSYEGDGATIKFDVTFEFHAATDLEVILVTVASGVERVQTQGFHYQVEGGDGGLGQIRFTDSTQPPASGERVVIRRISSDLQPDDLRDGGALAAEPLERRLDIITARLQELETDVARSLKVAKGSQASESALTLNLTGGMGASLQVANDELGIITATGTVPDNVATSPFGETWVGLADEVAGRSNLGLTSAATTALGASGATIPLLNGANTYSGASTFSEDATFNSNLIVGAPFVLQSEILTIDAGGQIAPTKSDICVNNNSGAPTDDLDTIAVSNHPVGAIIELRAATAGQVPTLRHAQGGGNIYLDGNASAVLDDRDKTLWLQRRDAGEHGAGWYEVGRSPPMAPQLLHIRSIAAAGGGGGLVTLNNWTRSILNDFVFNDIGGASLDPASVIVLPAGVYHMSGYRSFYRTDRSRVRLHNLTDDVTLVISMSGYSNPFQASPGSAFGDQIHVPLQGRFALNGVKAIDLQYLVRIAGSGEESFSLGRPTNDGLPEIYADLMFHKIG